MNIIVEGSDNSGKSTLCAYLGQFFNREIIVSAGPPNNVMNRVRSQLSLDEVIFDRHVCISQSIYGTTLRNDPPLPDEVMEEFYAQNPIIIFCKGPTSRGLNGHVRKLHDTREHIRAIEDNMQKLQDAYVRWAVERAHIFFRWSDDADRVCAFIEGALNDENNV